MNEHACSVHAQNNYALLITTTLRHPKVCSGISTSVHSIINLIISMNSLNCHKSLVCVISLFVMIWKFLILNFQSIIVYIQWTVSPLRFQRGNLRASSEQPKQPNCKFGTHIFTAGYLGNYFGYKFPDCNNWNGQKVSHGEFQVSTVTGV